MSTIRPPDHRPRLRRDAARNRHKILAAARKLVAERGLDVGYEEIAREADVGVGTVYRRFPSRDGLFQELFQDRVDAVVAIAEEALAVADPWLGLCQFLERDLELQEPDRGLRQFLLGRADSTDLRRLAGVRISPLVAALIERARVAGRLRADVGHGDIEIILAMIGALLDASIRIEPDLWRRHLAMLLDGIHLGEQRDRLPGASPGQSEVERILRGWVPPPRSQPREPDSTLADGDATPGGQEATPSPRR